MTGARPIYAAAAISPIKAARMARADRGEENIRFSMLFRQPWISHILFTEILLQALFLIYYEFITIVVTASEFQHSLSLIPEEVISFHPNMTIF